MAISNFNSYDDYLGMSKQEWMMREMMRIKEQAYPPKGEAKQATKPEEPKPDLTLLLLEDL